MRRSFLDMWHFLNRYDVLVINVSRSLIDIWRYLKDDVLVIHMSRSLLCGVI
jgi:hypothetical protein